MVAVQFIIDAHRFTSLFLLDPLIFLDRFGRDGRVRLDRISRLYAGSGSGDGSPRLAGWKAARRPYQDECHEQHAKQQCFG